MERDKKIIKVSVQGIVVNLILVAFKAVVGLLANSIAIVLDAVNNLSDALSQLITIVGTKLAAKAPDQKHPFGYGRIEYISSVLIGVLILTAGLTSLRESIDKTLHPEVVSYTVVTLVIIGVAVVVKFLFGRYVTKVGKEVQSQAVIGSGKDCTMDSFLSLSTLIAALISILFHVSLEGILGVVLSVLIIKAGVEVLGETLGSLIGDQIDNELALELKKKIRGYDGVLGAYDLVLHDYGPARSYGTVHVEVEDTFTASQIHHLSRDIRSDIEKEYGITLTVGVYASNRTDARIGEMKAKIIPLFHDNKLIRQMHAFYVDFDKKYILFDLVISFKAKNAEEICDRIAREVEELYPEYACAINLDRDFSD